MKHYDAIIIGFGKGGKTLAGKLAGIGKTVAIIEKSDQMYGGTCINVGCIPSKSLVRNSSIASAHGALSFEQKVRWYQKAVEEKNALTGMLRNKNYHKLADLELVEVYNGEASFVSNTEVSVKMKGSTVSLTGDQIFINTGSEAYIPAIEGIEDNPYVYTSETLMDLTKLPKHLVIVGGGYIGLEFASMYSGFGSEVTVIQDSPEFIAREDRDLAAEIKKVLEEKGIRFLLGADTKSIRKENGHADVLVIKEGEEIHLKAEAVLLATGRRANTKNLHVEAAGVELTKRGEIKVDENLKTTAPNIWAMGDVKGGLQFTYVSFDDFRIVWSQLSGGNRTAKMRTNVPYSVFISPSFSRVGLNEKEAKEAGYTIKTAVMPASAIPKAQVLASPNGMLKAIVDADTNKILGAMLFCEESYEMINIIKLAMDMNADYTVLRDQIFTHPTMSEALNDLFGMIG